MDGFLAGVLGGNPWFWLSAWVFFMVIEAWSVSAISLWFAVGAFAAFIASFFITSAIFELTLFITVSLFTVITLRQWALSKLSIGKTKTNVDDLIGQEAVVTEPISFPDGGRVKLRGNSWRCQSDSHTRYETGSLVTILRIEGVTLYVE